MTKTILLDTNFLVECAANKIDIEKELTRILDFNFDIAILDRTMEELDTLIARKGKTGQAAKLAKMILMTKKTLVLPTEGGHTDNILLKEANENTIIATMDQELKRRLKAKKQDVIIIRAKKKLELVRS
ncbi:hypothetical protein COV18_00100 [Candidatus Woesearchaeota archaeon CG10_big_fil_rev_8_21_14_0_10_37_12]|nr:MAG: hypothetical protein COV18_00100 [Candidatus Woesearchaeota archaeon CG10_big_fil_rev_8_21_14_0_10_37_12]